MESLTKFLKKHSGKISIGAVIGGTGLIIVGSFHAMSLAGILMICGGGIALLVIGLPLAWHYFFRREDNKTANIKDSPSISEENQVQQDLNIAGKKLNNTCNSFTDITNALSKTLTNLTKFKQKKSKQ